MTADLYRHILTINPTSPEATDIVALHKLVMAGYRHAINGTPSARQKLGILFLAARPTRNPYRTSTPRHNPAGPTSRILVQATVPGAWADTEYTTTRPDLALQVGNPIKVDTTLTAGQTVELRMLINPTRRDLQTRRIIPVRGHNEAAAWLARKLTDAGLNPLMDTAVVGPSQRLTGHRKTALVSADVRQMTVTATVQDPQAAQAALTRGIGRARSWGAGLIRHRTTPSPHPWG